MDLIYHTHGKDTNHNTTYAATFEFRPIVQARSSLYANTQLRAHRCAEKKNKEQKKKNMHIICFLVL